MRAALVFLDGLFDSVPGIVVMTSGTLVAGHWYTRPPARPGGRACSHDQMLGGGLMLTLAELVGLPFLLLVFIEWGAPSADRTAELDARLDREAELAGVTAEAAGADRRRPRLRRPAAPPPRPPCPR